MVCYVFMFVNGIIRFVNTYCPQIKVAVKKPSKKCRLFYQDTLQSKLSGLDILRELKPVISWYIQKIRTWGNLQRFHPSFLYNMFSTILFSTFYPFNFFSSCHTLQRSYFILFIIIFSSCHTLLRSYFILFIIIFSSCYTLQRSYFILFIIIVLQ